MPNNLQTQIESLDRKSPERTPRLVDKLAQLPQLSEVTSDVQAQGLSAYLEIDRDTAGRFGITPATM